MQKSSSPQSSSFSPSGNHYLFMVCVNNNNYIPRPADSYFILSRSEQIFQYAGVNNECIAQLFYCHWQRSSQFDTWFYGKFMATCQGAALSAGGGRVWMCMKSVREFQLINLPIFQWKFTAVKRLNMLIKAAFCRWR